MRLIAQISLTLLIAASPTYKISAHNPVEFLEVSSVSPSIVIEHDVELQSVYDMARIKTQLSGPELFSEAVGCLGRPIAKTKAYLNWYRIVDAKQEPRRKVSVLDMVRDNDHRTLTIGNAGYLLTPAQRIGSGPPDAIPHGLDHYKAYQVFDAASVEMPVEIIESDQSKTRSLAKPIFVCVPVQQWHHEDHIEASHPRDGFVVYELDSQPRTQKVNTIDQFGLNELQKTKSDWLCVRATLLESIAE